MPTTRRAHSCSIQLKIGVGVGALTPGPQKSGLGLRVAVRAEKAGNVHAPQYDQHSCPYTVCCDTDGHCLFMSTVVHIAHQCVRLCMT